MANDTKSEMPQWGLITSQIEPVSPLNSPQSEIKEAIDIADVLSKIETERRDKIASDAPQAWFPTSTPEAPIFVPEENGMHVSPSASPEASPSGTDRHPAASSTPTESVSEGVRKPIARIFGLKKSTLYILLTLTIIILAAIGGSLGGVLSHRSKKAKAASEDTGKPLMTFSLQTWEFADFTGRSQIFYTEDQFRTAFKTRAYEWKIGDYVSQEWVVCSMAFCLGDHRIGWWGSRPHVSHATTWNDSAAYGDVVNIKCGMTFVAPPCPFDGTSVSSAFATAPVFDPADMPETALSSTGTTRTSSGVSAKTTSNSATMTKA